MIEYFLYITSIILAFLAYYFLRVTERSKNLSYVAIMLAITDTFSLLSYHYYATNNALAYRALESLSGFAYMFTVILLFYTLHNFMFIKRGEMLASIVIFPAFMLLADETVRLSLLVAFFFLGATTILTLIVFTLALWVAIERRGGALFWVLVAILALFLLAGPLFSAVFSIYELSGGVPLGSSHTFKSIFLFLSNLTMVIIGYYYRKKIYAKLKMIEEA
ncbi:MAG: hypothetical protein ACP6IP_03865 [Candidatus Njordarchaeia archaeon]